MNKSLRDRPSCCKLVWIACALGGGLVTGWLVGKKGRPAIQRLLRKISARRWLFGQGLDRRQDPSRPRIPAAGLLSEPYGYEVPVQADAPWPTFRRDHCNTGRSPLAARYHGDRPWSFQTGKGIFSTPVIDGQGAIYVGSADHNFYAIDPDGAEKWRFQSGEIIDSAAALLRPDRIVVPSGDGHLYCLRADDATPLWTFAAPGASFNDWFEANVAVGPDGTLYAGNTNFSYYALSPDGQLEWAYETGANAWSSAGFGPDGTIYWASLDTKIHAVRPDGSRRWTRRTLGFVSASAAIGSDGTVYIGSFDSYFYALHPDTGRVKWKFKTGDHIYASAALGARADGQTDAIYFGSTDGIFYALNPDGELLWTYDTGAPIRSSPALGRAPEGEGGDVLYFGCGNGRLYALHAADGSRRWSFDTTPDDPELRDRNDLNGSPALGITGIYVGGEHGQLWYVPYDYPLHVDDPRGTTHPGQDLPDEMEGLFYVTPGGNVRRDGTPLVSPATLITLRLVVRKGGETVDARLYNAPVGRPKDALQIRAGPEFPFRVEQSADGRYIHVIPEGFLKPDQTYTLQVEGNYYTGGLHIGNLTLGGRKSGRFRDAIAFRVAESVVPRIPLNLDDEEVSALEWTRLAVPIPPMLPSLNQIGFDYMDWILGLVELTGPDNRGEGRIILWAVGGRRDENGVLVADPTSDFTLPLGGVYRGDSFVLSNRNFNMQVTGIPIPFNLFQLRGQLGPDLRVRPGATAYADTRVLTIPTFGPLVVLAGLANNWIEKLLVTGTYVTRPYQGPANRRPAGISVASVDYVAPTRFRAGRLDVVFSLEPGAAYPLAEHRPGVLLVDAAQTQAVSLDYHNHLTATADAAGNLRAVTLTVPRGARLPAALKAIVILDVFPLYQTRLT